MNSALLPDDLFAILNRFLSSQQEQTAATAREICANYSDDDNNDSDDEMVGQSGSAGFASHSPSMRERKVIMGGVYNTEPMYTTPCCSFSNTSGASPCCNMPQCQNSSMIQQQGSQLQPRSSILQQSPNQQQMQENDTLLKQSQSNGQRISRSQSAPITTNRRDCQRGNDAFCNEAQPVPRNFLGLQPSTMNDEQVEERAAPIEPKPIISCPVPMPNNYNGNQNNETSLDGRNRDLSIVNSQRQQMQQQQQHQSFSWLDKNDKVDNFEPNFNSTMINQIPNQHPANTSCGAQCGLRRNQEPSRRSTCGTLRMQPSCFGQAQPPECCMQQKTQGCDVTGINASFMQQGPPRQCPMSSTMNETSYMNLPGPQRSPCLRPPSQQQYQARPNTPCARQVSFREQPSMMPQDSSLYPNSHCPRYMETTQRMNQNVRCPQMMSMGQENAHCHPHICMNQGSGPRFQTPMGKFPNYQINDSSITQEQSSICPSICPNQTSVKGDQTPRSAAPRCPIPINMSHSLASMAALQSDFGNTSCPAPTASGRVLPIIFPDDLSDEERLAQRNKVVLFETLVKDHYCPGILQETLSGREDLNGFVFDLAFGGVIPPKPTLYDPTTMLEIIKMRIDYERSEIRKTYAQSKTEKRTISVVGDQGSKRANNRSNARNRDKSRRNRDELPAQTSVLFKKESQGHREVFTEDIDKHFERKYQTEVNGAVAAFLKAENEYRNSNIDARNDFEANVNSLESQIFGEHVKFNAYTATTTPIE